MYMDVSIHGMKSRHVPPEERVYYELHRAALWDRNLSASKVAPMPKVLSVESPHMEPLFRSMEELFRILIEGGKWRSVEIYMGLGDEWTPESRSGSKGIRFPGIYVEAWSDEWEDPMSLSARPFEPEYVKRVIESLSSGIPTELFEKIAGHVLGLYEDFRRGGYAVLVVYFSAENWS